MSLLSRAKPSPGGRLLLESSVNSTGSNALDPYTSDVDLRMTRRTDGAFWHAAKSWMAPITLSSFSAALPPERGAYDAAAACTTVSTSPLRMTLAMNGLRMSARTNSARPIRAQQVLARRDRVNGDDVVDRRVLREPGGQIPTQEPAGAGDQHDLGVVQGVIVLPRVAAPGAILESIRFSLSTERRNYLPSFLRCTRVRRSSLRCFFFDMRLRRFLMTEPMNSAT